MKKEEREVRKHFVKTRMNDEELEKLLRLHKKTIHRDLSTYLRRVLLQQPVTVRYRNQSADDFLREMLELKKELNAIGNNFNQAVHRLHLLNKIPEFRVWLEQYDDTQKILVNKICEIRMKMQEIYDAWLQK